MVETDELTSAVVLERIQSIVVEILDALEHERLPELKAFNNNNNKTRTFTLQTVRTFTNVLLVFAYCHNLLLSNRTTTVRELYYFYVTHFKNQRETEAAIWDACAFLDVPRHMLGLQAGSRGWFAGNLQLIDHENNSILFDGRNRHGGAPIGADWLLPTHQQPFSIQTDVDFVLVIEKEGIYQRFVQDGIWEDYNCLLVTGKGFPDLATRACVETLYKHHDLPILGLVDCDPFGVHVLHCYSQGSNRGGGDTVVDIQWVGLRPSQVQHLSDQLPSAVFQELTDLDHKKLDVLLDEDTTHPFVSNHPGRYDELLEMRESKVELEALHWLGMDYCETFLGEILLNVVNDEDSYDSEEEDWKRIL